MTFPVTDNHKESKIKLYNTILSCLPSGSKKLLSDNDIKLPSTILLKTPSFNYVSLCKFLEAARIFNEIIKIVFGETFNSGK